MVWLNRLAMIKACKTVLRKLNTSQIEILIFCFISNIEFIVSSIDKKKLKLIKKSFKNLNIDFAPIGIAAGSAFGPNGAAAGAFLGTYLFVGCLAAAVYGKYSSAGDVFSVAI